MSDKDKLKKMIAGTLGVNADDITDDFSLRIQKFKTSAGSVILRNMVKKVYGKKVDCRNVSTYGELICRIESAEESCPVSENKKHSEDMAKINDEELPEYTVNPGSFRPVCGIDIQEISIFPETGDYWSDSFYTDVFTPEEIAYCITAPEPRHSFAARWCLKEALHKCGSKYYGMELKDIRTVSLKTGELRIEIRGEDGGFKRLPYACSVSHADNYAVGMVMGYV